MENFKLIATAQIRPFKNKVKSFSQDDWDEFDFRQKSYKVHRNTETIPLIFDTDFRSDNLKFKPEVGTMLVFPSWLKHSVYPFYVDGERRSMSFNAYHIFT